MPQPNTDINHHLPVGPPRALILVPDTDGELRAVLDELEDLALSVAGCEDDDCGPVTTSDPLRSGLAAGALGRVGMALGAAELRDSVTPVAPDGRYELIPLLRVSVRRPDLDLLSAMAGQLATAAVGFGDEAVTTVLQGFARSAGTTPGRLAAKAARLHAALRLGWDADTEALWERLAPCGGRIVLTTRELDSYDGVIYRFMLAWHRTDDGGLDPLAQYLYQGGRP